MRIIGGTWRGRALTAPLGEATRPTADRVRQALFDRLMHATWARTGASTGVARDAFEGAVVLDAFAGTGALGLEALSRGAARAVFIETDRAALVALRANVAACGAEARCRVVPGSVLRSLPGGEACGLVFLDPPYGAGLVEPAVAMLRASGWIGEGALLLVEIGRDEAVPAVGDVVAEFSAGAARILAFRGV